MLNTPMTLVANGTKGHKVHWVFGDGGKADGDSLVHIYNSPDSFRIAISLDDESYTQVANTTIGIKSGIEDHLGTFHWLATYHFDSGGVVKNWSAEKDITLSSPAAGIVRISADNDSVMGWFNHQVDLPYAAAYKTDTLMVFAGSDFGNAGDTYPDFVYWNLKTNAIWFSRSQSFEGHGGKWEYRKDANYVRK
jgi:hypothetical protein